VVINASPSRIISIAVEDSDFSQYGSPFFFLPVAFQSAVDNLIKPETDQVILRNARTYERNLSILTNSSFYMDFDLKESKINRQA
jgi:hypothetical protein